MAALATVLLLTLYAEGSDGRRRTRLILRTKPRGGDTTTAVTSPEFTTDPMQFVRVAIDPATTYGGLALVPPSPVGPHSNSSLCPHQFGVEDVSCDWFAIQDSAGVWVNASVAIGADGASLTLTAAPSAAGATPNATRNGWADWPVVSVYNAAGLPLTPWPPQALQ